MIEGIEGEIHGCSFALQALPAMSQSMRAGIVIANRLGSASACYSVGAVTFFVRVCDLNAIETIPLWIECVSARSNGRRRGGLAATRDRERRNRGAGAERSETKEGKIDDPARGRSQGLVCTGNATARA